MDGLDQPSTAGAPAALPSVGRTIRHHPHACGVRAATSWGAAERDQDAAGVRVQLDHGIQRDAGYAVITCPVCSRAV